MLGQVNACYFLKPGDRLMIIRAKRKRKVTVVKEYPYHILVDVGMYKESINKIDVLTEDVRLIYRKMASEGMEIPKDIHTEKKPEKSNTPEKKISITEVRAVMAEKSRAGKTQEIKQLLKEFGADKLSSVLEERYEELMKRAEVL